MNYLEEMKKWKSTPTKDKILIKELNKINEKNVGQYFGKTMTFGTAGIRGILGAGTNKINEFTIAAAAYAYAATLLKESNIVKKMGLVIAHDNRQNGAFFAEITTRVFDHLGIKTYIFKNNEMTSTPVLSYAIRKLRAAGGVNITASHNPKEYNGFKVYSAQGSQLMPEITKKISKLMDKMNFLKVPYGLFKPTYISKTLVQDYISDVLAIRKRKNDGKQLIVVYSALNGTGAHIAPYLFQKMDIEYYEVAKEMKEDPLFKGLKSCNPEDEEAYARSIKLARKKNADIIILTDPDADRVGLAIRIANGSYKKINGNQTGAIVLNHLIRTKQLKEKGYIVQSIVTGSVTKEMAKRHNLEVFETHVGFKNIAEIIRNEPEKLIMGYEESYGQLINSEIARDKDAFQGLVLLVEAANYLKTQNKSLVEEINLIGKMYGFHNSTQISKQMTDEEVKTLFEQFSKIKEIANLDVEENLDFTKGEINGLEATPLIKIILENGSWIAMRPSGTEPKVKFYIETVGRTQKESEKLTKQFASFVNGSISNLRKTNKQANKVASDMNKVSNKMSKSSKKKKPSNKTKTIELQAQEIQTEKEMLAQQRAQFQEEMKQSTIQPIDTKTFTTSQSEKQMKQKPTAPQVETQIHTMRQSKKEKNIEEDPKFSLNTISPIPTRKTPSQMDPKQVQKTKELRIKQREGILKDQSQEFKVEKPKEISEEVKVNNSISELKHPLPSNRSLNEKLDVQSSHLQSKENTNIQASNKKTEEFDFEEDFFKTRSIKDNK